MKSDDDRTSEMLPSGLVTFVFTDIEASTRLYKALGTDVAGDVFDRHNELLRAAWIAHNGIEIHTEGDSFFVAFEDRDDAIAACVEVQRSLSTEPWPTNGEVRVRIGIHAGLAAPRNGDYMALAVHQAARVMSAAHGCQIVVTESTLEQMTLGDDIQSVRLGAFQLRDFDDAPVLFRIDPHDLDANSMPLRATPANHHNLVQPLTSFIGRNADVVTINGLLGPGTVVTLVGPGGMGKTRLATEVGLDVAAAWVGGVWICELAEVVDADLVIEEIAASLGVPASASNDRWQDLVDHIGEETALIILDNVEHQIDACAQLVPRLLAACPNIAVLSTSREPLNIAGETIYRVRPLDVAEDPTNHEQVTNSPSVQLFVDRARTVSRDLELSPEAMSHIANICRNIDGLPLAIEIAAAQVGVMQPREILEGLSNRFRLLRSRDRSLPERQRTMEGLLGWSYHLLNDAEQQAFRRLSAFAGSFSIDAAVATLTSDGLDAEDVPELIWALVDKSLITADFSDSATRYRLFETVQQYAMRLLIDNDDAVVVATRLGQWLLERLAPWHVNDRRWLGEVAVELATIRGVVDLIGDAEPEVAQQLMYSIGRYHDSLQSFDAGVDELTRALDDLPAQTPTRVALLAALADLHLRQANTNDAQRLLEAAQELSSQVGQPEWNDVAIERTAGELAARSGDHVGAARIAETTLKRPLSPRGEARMLNLLGIARFAEGDPARALDAFAAELAVYESLNLEINLASAHGNVAEQAWQLGDRKATAFHQRACLDAALALGQPIMIAFSQIVASRLAGENTQWQLAIQLQASAESILDEAGHQLYDADRVANEATLHQATEALGPQAVESAMAEGLALDIIRSAELACSTLDAALSMQSSSS